MTFLRLSLVTCPVYPTSATTETKRIRLNQLNADTGNRVKQQLIDAETGEWSSVTKCKGL